MVSLYELCYDKKEFDLVDIESISNEYKTILESLPYRNALFGLCFDKSPTLVALVSAIKSTNNAFCFLDAKADENFRKRRCLQMRVNVLLSPERLLWPNHWELAGNVWISVLQFADDNLSNYGPEFSFAICTSGSTGDPKTVLVPPDAIMPNVEDFIERFELNQSSRLLWSTSLDFDPSILELLIALETRCNFYVAVADKLMSISILAECIMNVKPDILQITPAVLSLFSKDFLTYLFGSDSPVKNLLIGGDVFPVALVRRFAVNPSVRIFNVYGLTEVSCWATCTEYNIDDEYADASLPIRGTEIMFEDEGVIVSGRECIVEWKKSKSVNTGDQFTKMIEKGVTKYIITGREKINGEAVSRDVENYVLENHREIELSRLVVYNGQRFLFLKTDRLADVELPKEFKIQRTFKLENFPLTANGKVNDLKLKNYIQSAISSSPLFGAVVDFCRNNPHLSSCALMSAGFSSKDLFEFLFLITEFGCWTAEELESIRSELFDESTLLERVFSIIRELEKNGKFKKSDMVRENLSLMETKEENSEIIWKYRMRKCVDYSAEVSESLVFIGDMSGYMAVLRLRDGYPIFECQEKSAITAKPIVCGEIAAFCAVDGYVHLINIKSDFAKHSFKIGTSIRSDPLIFAEGQIIIATFDAQLSVLNIRKKTVESICNMDNIIRNAPLITEEFLIVSTVNGVLSGFRRSKYRIRWRRSLKKQILAPLSFVPSITEYFVALSLDGDLFVLRIDNGELIRSISISSQCSTPMSEISYFDSPVLCVHSNKSDFHLIEFLDNGGIFNRHSFGIIPFIHNSAVISAGGHYLLKVFTDENPFVKLLEIDFENKTMRIIAELEAPSFGSLLFVDTDKLIVGSRDNFIYCFRLLPNKLPS